MNNQIKIQAKEENNILIIPSRIGKELENSNLICYEDFVPYAFNRELVTSLEIDKPKDVIVNVNGQDIKAKAYTVIEVNQLRNTEINIMNDMEEVKMTKLPKFKFNSNSGVITIDGKEIITVTDIKINCNAKDGYAKVIITFDADVEVEGDTFMLPHYFRRTDTIAKIIDENK